MVKKKKKQIKDSVDVDQITINTKDKIEKELSSNDTQHNEHILLRYRIPIASAIYKIKDKHAKNDKKHFFIYLLLIVLSLFISIILIVCGALWSVGIIGGVNTGNNETSLFPGLLMAFGVSILVVV